MSVRTTTNSWHLLLIGAPWLGVAFMFLAATQGEPEVLRSAAVLGIMAPLSLLAAAIAWWMQRALSREVTPVAQAKPGVVALKGTARAMPGRKPLMSPSGTACVWYRHVEQGSNAKSMGSSYAAAESRQAFLLVDPTGSCIVLPEGADLSGAKRVPSSGGHENLILEGDALFVVGSFALPSATTLAQQTSIEAEPAPYVVLHSQDQAQMDVLQQRGKALFDAQQAGFAARQPSAPTALVLPVICKPSFVQPFIIIAHATSEPSGFYRLMGWLNLSLALIASALLFIGSNS